MLNEQKRTGSKVDTVSEEMSSFHLHCHIIPEGFALGPPILASRRTGNAVPVGGTQHRLAMLPHEGVSSNMGDDPHESNSALVVHLRQANQSYALRPEERCLRDSFANNCYKSAALSSFSVIVQIQGHECNGDRIVLSLWITCIISKCTWRAMCSSWKRLLTLQTGEIPSHREIRSSS